MDTMLRQLATRQQLPPFNLQGLFVDDGGPVWQRTATALAKMPDDEICVVDIATLNLFCAFGLVGEEDLDLDACHQRIADWTKQVEIYTRRSLPRFHRSPEEFDRSLPKFKTLCMVTALQRDLGVQYHLPFSEGEYNGSDSRNLFIHGILSGHGGACVSLPVLYIAIGKRTPAA